MSLMLMVDEQARKLADIKGLLNQLKLNGDVSCRSLPVTALSIVVILMEERQGQLGLSK
jgi:hypothetical protein